MTIRTALFWIAAACCVFAEVAILRSLLFGRARRAEQQHYTGALGGRSSRPVEIAWALLPAVGLLFVLYLTWRAVDGPATPSSDTGRVSATIGA
jgi:heme/copper-type cytochrome/quinol oxidase subunit 2